MTRERMNIQHQEMPHRDLDPHARPPDIIKDLYKRYQKLKGSALLCDADLLDLQRDHASLVKIGEQSEDELQQIFECFHGGEPPTARAAPSPVPIYRHEAMPGITFSQALRLSPSSHHHFYNPLISNPSDISGRTAYHSRSPSTRNPNTAGLSSCPSRHLQSSTFKQCTLALQHGISSKQLFFLLARAAGEILDTSKRSNST
jgi:hypothetical protein